MFPVSVRSIVVVHPGVLNLPDLHAVPVKLHDRSARTSQPARLVEAGRKRSATKQVAVGQQSRIGQTLVVVPPVADSTLHVQQRGELAGV